MRHKASYFKAFMRASVAIPRLAATRDDAELSKAATNIGIAVSDIAAYYTAQGDFNSDMTKMTNVPSEVKVGKKTCATISIEKKGGSGTDKDDATGKILIKKGTDAICNTLWAMDGLKTMCEETKAATTGQKPTGAECVIKVGGSSIFGTSTTTTGGTGNNGAAGGTGNNGAAGGKAN